jgi:hypothetical protein
MDAKQLTAAAETHLNDLQADIEASSRLIDQIHHQGARIRKELEAKEPYHAATLKLLMKQLAELKAWVLQQRALMRELRHNIRDLRQRV